MIRTFKYLYSHNAHRNMRNKGSVKDNRKKNYSSVLWIVIGYGIMVKGTNLNVSSDFDFQCD